MTVLKQFFRLKVYLWMLVLVTLLMGGVLLFGFIKGLNGSSKTVTVSTTISSLEKTNEVVFLNTGLQKVISAEDTTELFEVEVPLSKKSVLMVLHYKAKFGIKEPVSIQKFSEDHYQIKVPKIEIIGVELDKDIPYQLYDKSGELLSFATEDIDTGELVVEQLRSAKQEEFLTEHMAYAHESAQDYYTNIFRAIDSEIQLDFVFSE